MVPGQPVAQSWIGSVAALGKVDEKLIVIAPKHDPVITTGQPVFQKVDHTTTVWPPIRVVAQEHDAGLWAPISFDQPQNTVELNHLAVDIANGVGGCGHDVTRLCCMLFCHSRLVQGM